MEHITEGVCSMCHAQQELLQKYVNFSLVQDVAAGIHQINKSSEVIADRSGKLNTNADNLIQLANDLNKSMKKFTI